MDEPTPSTSTGGDTKDLQQQQQLVDELTNVDKDLAAVAAAEEFLQRNEPAPMLPYQHEMFVDVLQSDCLVVCAK